MSLLVVEDLHARVLGEEKDILRGIDLAIDAGEVHAIMGPNGSGKSTLAQVLAGRGAYEVTRGRVTFDGQDLLAMTPETRAREGLFLAFQYPVEIPGVGNTRFLHASLNAIRKHRGEEPMDLAEFARLVQRKRKLLDLDETLLTRGLNEGFSGGEKKRNEIFQMAVLDPRLAILDETDSGLDIDALRAVADAINTMRDPKRAILVVTHYERLLEHVEPDRVHVLAGGRIVRSGTRDLARELERHGYAALGASEA